MSDAADLSWASTDQLMEELLKRGEYVVIYVGDPFCSGRPDTAHDAKIQFIGDARLCMSACTILKDQLLAEFMDTLVDPNKDSLD